MDQNNVPLPPAREPVRFTPRDWLALACALGLALLWTDVFGLAALSRANRPPALGAAAFTAAVWAAVLLYLGRDARWNRWNAGLAAGVGLLALACAVYGDAYVRMINCLLILCGSALAFFSLSGSAENALRDIRVLPETLSLTFHALFSHWDKPFRALRGLKSGDARPLRGILAGILAALPVLALVIWLLSSADAVFGAVFSSLTGWLAGPEELTDALLRALRTLLFALAFFSAVYFLRRPRKARPASPGRAPASAAAFAAALSLLCAVYAVFDVIQFAFLFGGAETAAMRGGFAEYARSGFFQLVAVAGINLAAVLLTTVCGDGRRLLRALSFLLLALTWVILFSAFWRMRLYISAYGLSLLRAMTLWAMAFIALCLVFAAWKVWKPDFRFWPVFAALGLAGWIVFNFVNIDARIADYNVGAYLDGRLEDVDIYYLARLSPDTLPALERLRDAVGGGYAGAGPSDFYLSCDLDTAVDGARERWHTPASWRDWCLACVRYQ